MTPKKTTKKATTKKRKKAVAKKTATKKEKTIVVVSPVDPSSKLVVAAELSDDSIIEQELQGGVLPYFIYQFGQGDKRVTGLTVKGVSEVVRRLNRDKKSGYNIRLNPQHCTIERDVEQDGQKGVAVTVYAENLLDGNSAWGTKFEPYKKTGRNGQYTNEFAVEKALSKAERNAKRKLIPETAATLMIEKLIAADPANVKQLGAPPTRLHTVTPLPPKKTSPDQVKNLIRRGVRAAKTIEMAKQFDKKTQAAGFDAAFKKEIRELASKRVDELNK